MNKWIVFAVVLLIGSCTVEVEPEPVATRPGCTFKPFGKIWVCEKQRPALPQACAHLYNVGRHREWADCMGVGYK